MVKNYYYISKKESICSIVFLGLLMLFFAQKVFSATDTVEVELLVEGCNNNLICESRIGETITTCPTDCTPAPTPTTDTTSAPGAVGQYIDTAFAPENIFVDVGTDSAVLFWKTKNFVRSFVSWGTTEEYELGNSSELSLGQSHQISIKNLFSGKKYFYRIDFEDTYGRRVTNTKSFFITQVLPDNNPPVNPTIFSVVETPKKLDITWQNPVDTDFESVKITRSTTAYPRDPFEGKVVYEGRGNFVSDTDLQEGIVYYYAVFAKDLKGNYSSGTVFTVGDGLGSKVGSNGGGGEEIVKSPLIETEPLLQKLLLSDFIFTQEKKETYFSGKAVEIDGAKPLTISIPYEKLPEILKTIVVHVRDPQKPDEVFSFLLRVDDFKTRYTGTIGAFYNKKDYIFEVQILDFKNQMLRSVDGVFEVSNQANTVSIDENIKKPIFEAVFSEYPLVKNMVISVLFLGLFLLIKKLFIF